MLLPWPLQETSAATVAGGGEARLASGHIGNRGRMQGRWSLSVPFKTMILMMFGSRTSSSRSRDERGEVEARAVCVVVVVVGRQTRTAENIGLHTYGTTRAAVMAAARATGHVLAVS